jgi:hypothetical protein
MILLSLGVLSTARRLKHTEPAVVEETRRKMIIIDLTIIQLYINTILLTF